MHKTKLHTKGKEDGLSVRERHRDLIFKEGSNSPSNSNVLRPSCSVTSFAHTVLNRSRDCSRMCSTRKQVAPLYLSREVTFYNGFPHPGGEMLLEIIRKYSASVS